MCSGKSCDNFQLAHVTGEMRYTKTGGNYAFKVRQRNDCGVSEFSDALEVHVEKVPDAIKVDKVIDRECSMRFVWAEGKGVAEYKLTVRG